MSVIKNLIELAKDWLNEPFILIVLLLLLGSIPYLFLI